jgi:hypothetical protein
VTEAYWEKFKQEDGSYIFPPGIYFGIPEEVYHADKSLGSSRIKALAVDPYEAQFDHLYGEDKDTDALIFGSALHARMLEGRQAFEARFCHEFDSDSLKDCYKTADDIKKRLESHGVAKLSGRTKPELTKLLLDLEPDAKIYDVEKAKWDKANEGKTALKPKRWAQVETAARWVQRDPLLAAVMTDGTFSHGAPEVSIFYEDRGVRLKCRFDRLLRHAIVDLKSFAAVFGGKIDGYDGTALKTIFRMSYDLQAADYLRGWQFARDKLFPKGLVFGEPPYDTFLDECFDRVEPSWIWILVKSKGAPQALVIDWRAKMAKASAAEEVERAIDTYVHLRDLYGEENEWPPQRPAMTVEDQDLPPWAGRRS